MCLFTYDKIICPYCIHTEVYTISLPTTTGKFPCEWARAHRVRPAKCVFRREECSGEHLISSGPCTDCKPAQETSSTKVAQWIKGENDWREQNPLEDRYGEDIPEAERGWMTPLIPGDDAETTIEQPVDRLNAQPGPGRQQERQNR